MHKLLFLLLLAIDGLLPSCRRTLLSFFCSTLDVDLVWFERFFIGSMILMVKLIENHSLFIKTAGKIKF
jgi:hypothetical protein